MLNKKKFVILLQGINIVIASYVLLFITSILSVILTQNIGNTIFDKLNNQYISLYTQIALPMLIAIIILPIFIEKKFYKTSFNRLGFSLFGKSKMFSLVVFVIFVSIYISLFFMGNETIINIFLLSIYVFIQCFGEEILFRSVIQRRLHLVFRPCISIILGTVIFVFIFHEDTILNNLLYRTPIALLLSYTFYKTKSIIPTTVTHFVYNMYYSL